MGDAGWVWFDDYPNLKKKKKGFEIIVRFNLAFLNLKDKLGTGTFFLS